MTYIAADDPKKKEFPEHNYSDEVRTDEDGTTLIKIKDDKKTD